MWTSIATWYTNIKTVGFVNSLIGFDAWVNYKLLNGNEGETISSRLGRYIERDNSIKSFASKVFCRTILLPLGIIFDNSWKHCRESIQEEHRDESDR